MKTIQLAKGDSVLSNGLEQKCTGHSAKPKHLFKHTWTFQTVKTLIVLAVLGTAIAGLLTSQGSHARLAGVVFGFSALGLYVATMVWAAQSTGHYWLPLQLWNFLKTISIWLAGAIAIVMLATESGLPIFVLSILTLSIWALSHKSFFKQVSLLQQVPLLKLF